MRRLHEVVGPGARCRCAGALVCAALVVVGGACVEGVHSAPVVLVEGVSCGRKSDCELEQARLPKMVNASRSCAGHDFTCAGHDFTCTVPSF